jgi:RNA polymerase sigma factor (sigma-70 family)
MRGFKPWFEETGAGDMQRYALFYTGNEKLAEEIAQDAAIKAYAAWSDPEKRDKILNQPGYVRAIVRHCFFDYIKVPSRTSGREAELDPGRHDWPVSEEHQDLRIAVLSLDDDERDMVYLHYYCDLTIKEAGHQLGLSQSRSYRLHDKALTRLKGLLDEGEGEA